MTDGPRQTIEWAFDREQQVKLLAPDLLSMSEADFSALRRRTLDRGRPHPLFCGACDQALWLSRKRRGDGQVSRHFVHRNREGQQCPWFSRTQFAPEQLMALRFHGEKESPEHVRLKQFIGARLEQEPDRTGPVRVDQVQLSKKWRGFWKRPDVASEWRSRHLAVELQISYTFLGVILGRDRFYWEEGNHILWVFNAAEEGRAVVIDERYYNRRNLFVLDEEAEDESLARGRLVLHCFYHRPEWVDGEIVERMHDDFVTLDDLHFDDRHAPFEEGAFRPWFHSFNHEVAWLRRDEAARVAAAVEARAKDQAAEAFLLTPAGFALQQQSFEEEAVAARPGGEAREPPAAPQPALAIARKPSIEPSRAPVQDSLIAEEPVITLDLPEAYRAALPAAFFGRTNAIRQIRSVLATMESPLANAHRVGGVDRTEMLCYLSACRGEVDLGVNVDVLIEEQTDPGNEPMRCYAYALLSAWCQHRLPGAPGAMRRKLLSRLSDIEDQLGRDLAICPPPAIAQLIAFVFPELRRADHQLLLKGAHELERVAYVPRGQLRQIVHYWRTFGAGPNYGRVYKLLTVEQPVGTRQNILGELAEAFPDPAHFHQIVLFAQTAGLVSRSMRAPSRP